MKKYIATTSFVGVISANGGDVFMLDEKRQVVKDLINAKLIEEVKEKKIKAGEDK